MTKVINATHVYTTGPAQDLEEYLLNQKIEALAFIGHPLYYRRDQLGPVCTVHRRGKLVAKRRGRNWPLPLVPRLVKDFWLGVWWGLTLPGKWDLYVGSNNLNACVGLVLRRLRKVEKVIFYAIDYSPGRYRSGVLNTLYHWADWLCVKYCDVIWNLSPRMAEGRHHYRGLDPEVYNRQQVVPVGVWYDRIPRKDWTEIEKHTLVFMGHLLEKQGVQEVIKAIPEIVEAIPDFRFKVVGSGPFKSRLEELVREVGVGDYVEFMGYIEEHREVEEILSKCALAVALYNSQDTFTYYADPAKLKVYLACGLPVLVTDVPHNAWEIEKQGCGRVIVCRAEDIARAVTELMLDEMTLQTYRQRATDYARQFDWNIIFRENLELVLGQRKGLCQM